MRQIKASEVKPGMEVEFTLTRKMTIHKNTAYGGFRQELRDDAGHVARVDAEASVTVLSEPAPAQPEEPRWVAARVRAGGYRFFRVDESDRCWRRADHQGRVFPYWYTWDEICDLGTVTVVPDQGWAVPADTPEVPERITEWPEDDTALRAYPWRDTLGIVWRYGVTGGEPGWSCGSGRVWKGLIYGPFTRVTDA